MEPMNLKDYQREVLKDLDAYMDYVDATGDLRLAFARFWEERGVSVSAQNDDFMHPYRNDVAGVPNVTVKVPTAGGKTFIACNAIDTIFKHYHDEAPQVVAWFVPSDTILKQTYRNLSNTDHPYRQKIDSLFNSRVNVIDKETALMGTHLSLSDLREHLTIFVLSVQSFAANNKDGRRVYRENENLTDVISKYEDTASRVEGADEYSLMNLLYHLNPVVIVDESHNFEADLRVDMLKSINPRFILDLTATPKAKSNIISFVDAYKLKLENMVKLPVIVYNMVETSDVLASAIRLQERLEERAIAQEQQGGRYIRPIVLLQAQPKTSEDNKTFDGIKGDLILMGIPESRIRIKTAEKDEIKDEDLMSKDCPVRYIITVNALKEGWDCPFAYVLASLANKTSRVDVEQILGRVLRLPHTEQHRDPMLNMSYVFTCSANFRNTLENITKGLNNAGFSERDYRLASPVVEPQCQESHSMFDMAADDLKLTNEEVEINAEEVKEKLNTSSLTSSIEKLEEIAIKQNSDYVKNVKARKESEGVSLPPEIKKTYYKIKDTFSQAKDIKLPQFFINSKTSDIFGGATQALLLKKENLSEGFDLSLQDKSINFVWTQAQAVQFDLDETSANHSAPVHKYLDPTNLDAFRRLIATMAPEAQKRQLAKYLAERVNSDEIASPHIRKYIKEILDHYTREEITDIIAHKEQALRLIKLKIDGLLQSYRKTKFGEWTDTNKVYMQPSFRFPDKLQLLKPSAGGIRKSLYEKEGEMNDFEYQVINAVANLDNVVFWHRNIEKRGFCINGFINHYPDFIVKLESGMIIIIETKGEQLANDDSAAKLELGTKWANMAGLSFYRYYMVFDHQPISNALTVQQLIDRIKQM